jgi:hypothetical protein
MLSKLLLYFLLILIDVTIVHYIFIFCHFYISFTCNCDTLVFSSGLAFDGPSFLTEFLQAAGQHEVTENAGGPRSPAAAATSQISLSWILPVVNPVDPFLPARPGSGSPAEGRVGETTCKHAAICSQGFSIL